MTFNSDNFNLKNWNITLPVDSSGGISGTAAEVTQLIGQLRDELDLTIILIEHDMGVVGGISDRVIALDHGEKIAEGSYEAVATDPLVIEAYLGRNENMVRK